jgi:hypothetical protein
MWIRFTKDFDFSPPERGGRATVSYKAGTKANVRRIAAEAAIAAGKAEPVKVEGRDGGSRSAQ